MLRLFVVLVTAVNSVTSVTAVVPRCPFRQRGVGLVELMVSMTIGLIILAGVMQLFVNSQQTSITASGASRIQENIRYAIARMGGDIYRAGNMGCFSFSAVGSPTASATGVLENQFVYNRLDAATAAYETTVTGPVNAYVAQRPSDRNNGLNADWQDFEGSFVSGSDGPVDDGDDDIIDETDTLIVKYADRSSAIAITGATPANPVLTLGVATPVLQDQLVMAGNCTGMYVFNVAEDSAGNNVTLTSGDHNIAAGDPLSFFYVGESGSHEYSIGNSVGLAVGDACTRATRQYCSLFRATNGVSQELVVGVSDLQVSYGYEDEDDYQDNVATLGTLVVDRVMVDMEFVVPGMGGNNLMSSTVTRVFAVRNQL
jgi:type IV pilus assembly protein PilW